jgi:hypothetical protein
MFGMHLTNRSLQTGAISIAMVQFRSDRPCLTRWLNYEMIRPVVEVRSINVMSSVALNAVAVRRIGFRQGPSSLPVMAGSVEHLFLLTVAGSYQNSPR